jgi:transferase family protein
MTTQLITPSVTSPLEIRCNVGDAMVANLAVHIVFFFERRLDAAALRSAFAQALGTLPLFAGRLSATAGRMRLRCGDHGVPFTVTSSERTLHDAVRATTDDTGRRLIDAVNGAAARWGLGPLCKVRVTQLADDATAIGISWHHAVGDMQTLMLLMQAWVAAAAGKPVARPLIVEDRAAYLDERLPADGAREPGVRCLSLAEFARSAWYLAKDSRRQRTLSLYFGDDEIKRMRDAYQRRVRLSANDVVCAHVCEALLMADPAIDRRTLAIAVNARDRCGLDPMLVGNVITTLNLDVRRGEAASSIAERLRRGVDHFGDEHCDMRINQSFLDAVGPWQAARCVSRAFDPAQWNPVVSNWSGFGVHRIAFEDTVASYCAPIMEVPVAGLGALLEGAQGRGLTFQMALPPKDFKAISRPAIRAHLHRYRRDADDIPALHRELHG